MCVERNTAILPLPQETVYAIGGRGNPKIVSWMYIDENYNEVDKREYLRQVHLESHREQTKIVGIPVTVRRKGRIVRFI